jgi:hypothetical protein
MPTELRKLVKEIERQGCSVKLTSKGHYLVLDPSGNTIEGFAASHGKKREVGDVYIKLIRKALSKLQTN